MRPMPSFADDLDIMNGHVAVVIGRVSSVVVFSGSSRRRRLKGHPPRPADAQQGWSRRTTESPASCPPIFRPGARIDVDALSLQRHGTAARLAQRRLGGPRATDARRLSGTPPPGWSRSRRERSDHTLQPTALIHEATCGSSVRVIRNGKPSAFLRVRRPIDAPDSGRSRAPS